MTSYSKENSDREKAIEVDSEEKVVRVSVNPEVYEMPVIYGAAHAFTRGNYVRLDKKNSRITVELKPFKGAQNLEELGRMFFNRLASYQVHRQKMKENEGIRNIILYRALASNSAITLINEFGGNAPEKGGDKKEAAEAAENAPEGEGKND